MVKAFVKEAKELLAFKKLNRFNEDENVEYTKLSVSLKINAGENVGIIGKTGSGKTTLVDLILRTYNIPDGTLFHSGFM